MLSIESLIPVMTRKKPDVFLKTILLPSNHEGCPQSWDNLTNAEREEKCIRRAVFLVAMVLMLSLAGIGYCALLLPEVLRAPHLFVRLLIGLGLGSLISLVAFLGRWLWHRSVVSHTRAECQRLILEVAQSQLQAPATPSRAAHAHASPHNLKSAI